MATLRARQIGVIGAKQRPGLQSQLSQQYAVTPPRKQLRYAPQREFCLAGIERALLVWLSAVFLAGSFATTDPIEATTLMAVDMFGQVRWAAALGFAVAIVAGDAAFAQRTDSLQRAAMVDADTNEPPPNAATSDPPTAAVSLASGRTFTGYIDTRTAGDTLWLRFEYGHAILWRPIEWSRVVSASVGAKEYDAAAFRKVASGLASTAKKAAWEDHHATTDEALSELEASQPTNHGGRNRSDSQPRSLAAAARVGNWDADAANDGVVVHLAPLDGAGLLRAATGTLTAELIGVTGRRRATGADVSYGPNDQRPVIESWSVQLSPKDFGDRGAVVNLPFLSGNPADRLELGNLGTLRLKFSVPGSDVLESVIDPIRLRQIGQVGEAGDLWP